MHRDEQSKPPRLVGAVTHIEDHPTLWSMCTSPDLEERTAQYCPAFMCGGNTGPCRLSLAQCKGVVCHSAISVHTGGLTWHKKERVAHRVLLLAHKRARYPRPQGGDSGSLVCIPDDKGDALAVGIFGGGTDKWSYVTPIADALDFATEQGEGRATLLCERESTSGAGARSGAGSGAESGAESGAGPEADCGESEAKPDA